MEIRRLRSWFDSAVRLLDGKIQPRITQQLHIREQPTITRRFHAVAAQKMDSQQPLVPLLQLPLENDAGGGLIQAGRFRDTSD
jgi:hypothetical protein